MADERLYSFKDRLVFSMDIRVINNTENEILFYISKIGCDNAAISILKEKSNIIPIYIKKIKPFLANIIKQEMISSKGDAVVNRHSISCKIEWTDILLLGTISMYKSVIPKFYRQNIPLLTELANFIKTNFIEKNNKRFIILKDNTEYDLSTPKIMGILNVTPDSFYDGGKYLNVKEALSKCEEMIKDGVDIIDVGGESTRPGSDAITSVEECNRILDIIKEIKRNFDIIVSVDTYKAETAERAINEGADIVNDISGLTFNQDMIRVLKEYKVPYVLMHIKGNPKNMQINPEYEDVCFDIINFFNEKIDLLLKNGIDENKIIIDPGFGFGKTFKHNIEIFKNLTSFAHLNYPLLVGLSRKSFTGIISGDLTNPVPPEDRLTVTLCANFYSLLNGASIIRVHDVKEHKRMLNLFNVINNFE